MAQNTTQATIGVEFPSAVTPHSPKFMPEKKERDKWWAFINGRPECEWNPPKKQRNLKGRPGKGMRSWDDSYDDASQYEVHYEPQDLEPQETIVVTERGEIKVEVSADIDTALPTPSSSPQPDASKGEGKIDSVQERARASSIRQQPRQPTPSLLKSMDSVCFFQGTLDSLLTSF